MKEYKRYDQEEKTFIQVMEERIVERFNSPKLSPGSPWTSYKRLSILMIFLATTAIPLIGILVNILKITQYKGKLEELPMGLYLTIVILFFILGIIRRFYRCPRCGDFFEWGFTKINYLFGKRCIHCGLPRYQELDESEQQENTSRQWSPKNPDSQVNLIQLTRKLLRLATTLWVIFIIVLIMAQLSR